MFSKSKKILILLAVIVLALSACTTTEAPEKPETGNPGLELGETTEDNPPETNEIVYKHEIIKDDSKPMKETTVLEGEFVTISEKANEAVNKYNQPHRIFDTKDGNLVLFYISTSSPAGVDLIKLDAKTGKILEQATAELLGAYIYLEPVIDPSVKGDYILGTSSGSYVFNLNDLENPPEQYLASEKLMPQMKDYKIADPANEKLSFTLDMERLSVSPVTKQVVYADLEGVYISDLEGNNIEKISDQVADDIWIPKTEGSEYKDSPLYDKTSPAYFTKPRFNADGTKVILDIINYSSLDPKLGLAVIDIASKNVEILKFYDPDSTLKETNKEAWLSQTAVWARGYNFYDNNTIVITISGIIDAAIVRYDIFYNINDNKVEKSFINNTGITSDYKLIALNDASSEIGYADLEKQGRLVNENTVILNTSSSSAIGISDTKTFVLIEGSGKAEGTFYYVIVNNPTL